MTCRLWTYVTIITLIRKLGIILQKIIWQAKSVKPILKFRGLKLIIPQVNKTFPGTTIPGTGPAAGSSADLLRRLGRLEHRRTPSRVVRAELADIDKCFIEW